jgi:hypothetical protein
MTTKEFQKDWKKYALEKDGKQRPLSDVFMLCSGPFEGGLLFDTGGPQCSDAYILKVGDNDECLGLDWDEDKGEKVWTVLGKLIPIL